MIEGYTTVPNTMRYFGEIKNGKINNGRYGAQIPFNFFLLSDTWMGIKSYDYIEKINPFLENMPKDDKIHANWLVRQNFSYSLSHKYTCP